MMRKILRGLKYLLGSLLFLALVFTLMIPMNNLFREFDDPSIVNSQIRIRQFYKQEKNSLDVVYIGSSSVYRFFIPPQIWKEQGFTSWVYASVGQPFQMTRYVMEEVEKTQSPKLYVVDMRQLVKKMEDELDGEPLSEGKQEYYYNSLYTAMPFSWTRTKSIFASVAENPVSWVFDFSRHHVAWKDWSFKKLFQKMWVSDPYANDPDYATYYATNCVAASSAYTRYEKPALDKLTERIALSKTFQSALDDLVNYVRKNQLPVLFISTPYVETARQRAIHNQLEDYFAKTEYTYLNFNKQVDKIGIDYTEDFSDKKHLNVIGQEKFSRYIGNYITGHYEVASEHSDAVVAEWNAALKNWNKESAELKEKLAGKIRKGKKENAA